ncbi:MAG: 30S ribosomal protein S15 [Brevinematales bacterium]
MAVTVEQKKLAIQKYGKNEKDTGNTEVQIAVLTLEINNLSQHLQKFPKDYKSLRGLQRLLGKRKSLLNYLHRENAEKYHALKRELGL